MTVPHFSNISPEERNVLRIVCSMAWADGQLAPEELEQIFTEVSRLFADSEAEQQQLRYELQSSLSDNQALDQLVAQIHTEEDRELALKLGYMVIRSSRRQPEEAWINPAEKVAYRRLVELLALPDETVTKIETLTDAELDQENDLMHTIAARLSKFLGKA
jgi:uncharacterized membrane protein YebE (DUF533 family)